MKPAMPSDPPPPRPADESGRPMTPIMAVGWSVAVVFAMVLLVSLTATFRQGAERDLVNGFVCQVLAMLGGLFAILRVHAPRASIRELVGLRATHPGFFALSIALGAAAYPPATVLYTAIVRRFPLPEQDGIERIFAEAGQLQRIFIGLVVVAFGPLLEEVFFRGAIFGPLRKHQDTVLVVVLTAVLFGFAHLSKQELVPLALLGMILGVVRASSGSLLPAVLLHATFNAIPMWSMAAGKVQLENDPTAPLPYGLAAACAVVTLALVAATRELGGRSEAAARAQARDRS